MNLFITLLLQIVMFLIAVLSVYKLQSWSFCPNSTIVLSSHAYCIDSELLFKLSHSSRLASIHTPYIWGQAACIYSSPYTKNRKEGCSCFSILLSPARRFQNVVWESPRCVHTPANVITADWHNSQLAVYVWQYFWKNRKLDLCSCNMQEVK